MQYTIPDPTHRLYLDHAIDSAEPEAQAEQQNERIVDFARALPPAERLVPVEVFYSRDNGDVSTEANFDAVLVDTVAGEIVGTLPPYDEIDPDWRSKR